MSSDKHPAVATTEKGPTNNDELVETDLNLYMQASLWSLDKAPGFDCATVQNLNAAWSGFTLSHFPDLVKAWLKVDVPWSLPYMYLCVYDNSKPKHERQSIYQLRESLTRKSPTDLDFTNIKMTRRVSDILYVLGKNVKSLSGLRAVKDVDSVQQYAPLKLEQAHTVPFHWDILFSVVASRKCSPMQLEILKASSITGAVTSEGFHVYYMSAMMFALKWYAHQKKCSTAVICMSDASIFSETPKYYVEASKAAKEAAEAAKKADEDAVCSKDAEEAKDEPSLSTITEE